MGAVGNSYSQEVASTIQDREMSIHVLDSVDLPPHQFQCCTITHIIPDNMSPLELLLGCLNTFHMYLSTRKFKMVGTFIIPYSLSY